MLKKILSIDIGINTTKICVLDAKNKNPKVYLKIEIDTPVDSIRDGELILNDVLIEKISKTLKEKKISTKQVVFTVTSTKIASREVTIPLVKENKIESVIRMNAKDYFPIDLSLYEIGFINMGKISEDNVEKYKLLVLAVPSNVLEGYRTLANKCGLQVVAIDYSGNSIFQMVKNLEKDSVKLVIKIDESSSLLTVVKEGAISLQRTVAYGLTEDVIFDLDHSDELHMDPFRDIMNGISRMLDYYTSRNQNDPIQEIYLTGVGSKVIEVFDRFETEFGVTVKRLGESGEEVFAAAIGAVRAPVSFFSNEVISREKAGAKKKGFEGTAYVVLACGTLLAIFFVASSLIPLAQEQSRYNANITKIESLEEIRLIYAQHETTKNVFNEIKTLYVYTENPNQNLLIFLEEVEQTMPASIQVTSFSSNATNVTMNIEVGSKEEMANAIQSLRNIKYLSSVQVLGSTDKIEEDGNRIISFSINGTYKTLEQLHAEAEDNNQ